MFRLRCALVGMVGKRKSSAMGEARAEVAHRLPALPASKIREAFKDGQWKEERKALFTQTVQVPSLRVPKAECHTVIKSEADLLLRWPKISAVQTPTEEKEKEDWKLVLLLDDVKDEIYETVEYPVTVTYDQYTASELLKAILPEDAEITTAFETIGHIGASFFFHYKADKAVADRENIAHLNLREDSLPYKHVVGHIIYDKNFPRIQTVVNKLDSIDTTFRFFKMEVIAGKQEFITSVVRVLM